MTPGGLTFGGALFMTVSWTAIVVLLVFCFTRIRKRR
jgi:uncharacterized membrane protein